MEGRRRLDLVGSAAGDALATERLRVRPSDWYLTAFLVLLVPSGMPPERCPDAGEEDDDFPAEVPEDAGLGELAVDRYTTLTEGDRRPVPAGG